MRDLIYDVIYPNVKADLRKDADVLFTGGTSPSLAAEMIMALFPANPSKDVIVRLINDVIGYYYPLVITEPISTPGAVNKLALMVLNPTDGSFCDAAAGLGGTCVAAGLYAKARGGALEIFAQEKMPVLCAVLSIYAYVNEIHPIAIKSGDVLTDPGFTENGRLKQFDFSISFPPLGASWSAFENQVRRDEFGRFDNFSSLSTSNSEWLFFAHQAASLKDTGCGIIAVSTGSLVNSTYKHYRNRAIRDGYIKCIITLPPKILPFTSSPLSLIVVDRTLRESSGILMIHAEELFAKKKARITDQLNEQMIDKIAAIYSGCCEVPNVSRFVEFEELIQEDCVLLPSRYIASSETGSEFGRLAVHLGITREWPKLMEVSKVYRGLNVSAMALEKDGGEYKIINYADIQDGRFDITALKTYDVSGNPRGYAVRPGDVLISCKGAVIKTCIVPDDASGVLLSINFIGIRLDESRYDPRFLKYYLDSPAGQAYLKGRQVGTSIITLTNKDLEQIPVPRLPLAEQKIYISDYEKIHKDISDEIKNLYNRLRHEKWRLYENMGLRGVLTILDIDV